MTRVAQLADSLRDYLIANPTPYAFGTESHCSQRVLEFQNAAGLEGATGVLGPAERRAAREFGVLLPERPLGSASRIKAGARLGGG